MASSSSSSSSRTWEYGVFTSFHGPDVRTSFLSHFRKQFNYNGITMFDDQRIVRGETIGPALTQAIKESRISIVVLSKNYASSSWCLDELLEILKCKEEIGQLVMTIFYGVNPSDVRKQTGEFGSAFNGTCARKTEEERRKWSKALNDVGNIAGEHFLNWDNEAEMIEKIARDVSDKLNATLSRDFDGMVGLEAHLREMESLLDLDNVGVKMVGISGPAGIGKSTIARALHSRLSNRFQLTCFVDNLRESYPIGLDEYGLKLRLQEQFLSKVLNQNDTRICHLGVVEERLCKQRVLVILDDVNNIKQLEALANETTWFGHGSRIVVTTENKELLQQHGINNIYHVGFPSFDEAVEIFRIYAFRHSSPRHSFGRLTFRAIELCGYLPLGLRMIGSSLQGKNEDEWEYVIHKLETIIDRDIEEVLRVGYDSLHENEQMLFLHIALFFNNKDGDLVKAMLAGDNLDIEQGLKILANKSLICISTEGKIWMHKLLKQMGRNAIRRQEPWNRWILIDAQEICDVLEYETGTRAVSGISFDTSGISEVIVSKRALKRMPNLRFLKIYNKRSDVNHRVHIAAELDYLPRLKLLHWEAYPSKFLPRTFQTECLVELNMQGSQLEYLWQGTQPLTNLKKMDLSNSFHLKELPDFSNATNLETLQLDFCTSLVELPSSIAELHKLEDIMMESCKNLEVIPTHVNLTSLKRVYMTGCSRLRSFPNFSTNITCLSLSDTAVAEVPASIRHWPHLYYIDIRGKGIEDSGLLPGNIGRLDLSYSDIDKIPDCIKGLHWLQRLYLSGCRQLASLPELPNWLILLTADNCESLECVACPLSTPNTVLDFANCFKLDGEARKLIIQQSFLKGWAFLPGREMPSEFNHRARGNSLTIRPSSASFSFKACVVVAKHQHTRRYRDVRLRYRITDKSRRTIHTDVFSFAHPRTKHLFICHGELLEEEISPETSSELLFEFSSGYTQLDGNIANFSYDYCEIIECGVQILTNESNQSGLDQVSEEDYDWSYEFEPIEILEHSQDNSDHTLNRLISCDSESDNSSHQEEDESVVGKKRDTDCWSWLFLCFDVSSILRDIGSLCCERRQQNP